MKILVTGAAGKVGQQFIKQFIADPKYQGGTIRAFCHNRSVETSERVEVFKGNISQQDDVKQAMAGVTHVVHLATCKETPESIMDVTIKGLFWLLEECRVSKDFEQFILIGGDAGMGHFFYPHPIPVTEEQKHSAYPGCYALSKVLEEVMLEQYYIQYDLEGCCLQAPWIMEKDDFRYTLSFGEDVFGGPTWKDYVTVEEAARYQQTNTIPLMLDPKGNPVLRNFVQLEDLVDAILTALNHPKAHQQLFNICTDEPVDYQKVADYLKDTREYPSVTISTEYQSTWLDNTKARFLIGWRPQYDYKRMIDQAFDYVRTPDDPRIVWYPG